ncbi:TonB-dependent receptor [Puia dinghuensis]|uniref:TonB-dependent receptor n=1 Tax=Puia dinghuensis TaxID=1792502 RepID=A0A8J2UEG6_9BACT|nr:TonB-dependent receptor [Puia dinghuensis]
MTDKNGSGLSGATIYIPDLKLGVVADTAGYYRFNSLPSGKYLIEVHSIGFKTMTRTVIISGPVTQDFTLADSYVEESAVVVTGLSKATQIKRNPVPIVAISHDYLATNISTNAIDAIAKIPGVRAVTTGPNVSKPYIRGLGYNRILTLYDGIRQEGQQWGDEHGIEVDQFAVDRVEVIKGPASLSFGSDALAGVVNLIPTQPAPEGKMIGGLTLDYQTNNKNIGGSAMLGATKNGFEWMGRISHKQAVDYQDKIDGRVFGTAYNETDANATLGLHRKWGYSHLDFVLFDDLQEIPDGSRDSLTGQFTRQITEADTVRAIVSQHDLNSYTIEKLHQHVRHYRIYSGNSFTLGEYGRMQINLGFQRSIRQEFSHPVLNAIPGLDLELNTYSYDVKYFLPDLDDWTITVGVNGMYQDNNVTNGTEFVIPSYHQFDIGPFVLAKRTFDKLDVSGGIRFDSRSFNNFALYTKPNPVTGFDMPVTGADTAGAANPFSTYRKNFTGFSGSFGATYNFSDKFSIKANISRGYRAPNIAEISANGVHPGTNFYQLGNPGFKPEFNLQEDAGFVFSSRYIVASLDLFNNVLSNYIYDQKLVRADGKDSTDPVSELPYFKYVASKAHLYGGEVSIDIHPVKALHFENSFSLIYGENKGSHPKSIGDSARYLPFIPPPHGLSELRYEFSDRQAHISNAFIKVQLEYSATQNRAYIAYGTETPTAGYTLFNAGIGGGFTNKKGKTIVNVYVMGDNLFDVAYRDHLSRLKYFYYSPADTNPAHGLYNMGRNISFKLDFPLDFSLKSDKAAADL